MAGHERDRPDARQAYPFFQAANINTITSSNFPALDAVWSSQILLWTQAVAIPLAFWFKPVCVCLALFWLTYRAYHVLNKPLDELALLLGFDLPLVPNLSLAGLKSDGAIVHWSLPENQRGKSSFKYEILLNGAVVGNASVHEDAVTISGLRPDTYYIARVALLHNQEFSAKSAPIRFQTKPASSGDFFHQPSLQDADLEPTTNPLVRVQPYRGLKDISGVASTHVPPTTATTVASIARKRSNTGWRNATSAKVVEDQSQEDGGEMINNLTEQLDQLRREYDEADRQAREEEEEESKQRDDLIKERDELRAELAEREKISRNLKREVNLMERQNTAAQNERSKLERQLQQKLQERERVKEDTARWIQEAKLFEAQAEQIDRDTALYRERAALEKEALQHRLANELAAVKSVDDEIRETTTEIKKMERGVKNSSPSSVDNQISLVEQFQQDAEEDRQHNLRKFELQSQYAAAVQKLEQSKRFYMNNMQYLEGLKERRQREEFAAAAAASSRDLTSPLSLQDRLPTRRDSQGSRRNGGSHDSPRPATFSPVSQSVFGGAAAVPTFSSSSIFSFGNMIPSNADNNINDDYRERLTGGALLSPEAGEGLIPADLFAAEDRPREVLPLPGLGALPGITQLPGLRQQGQDYHDAGPASPASISSRAASNFASPQASQQNLPFHLSSPEGFQDSDGRSVRSNRSGLANTSQNTGSRFSAMFGLRQRAKNSSLDDSTPGAPLGRFNSRSMPRQDQGLIGLDATSRKRNSSLTGNVLPLDVAVKDVDDVPTQARKRPFTLNPFSKDKAGDGWPSSFSPFNKRPVSPRPMSTHSGELPRPSFDSNRWGVDAWQTGEGSNAARASPLSSRGWNAFGNQSRLFESRHTPSKPSVQHGIGPQQHDIIEDEDDDDDDDDDNDPDVLDRNSKRPLAPIGTKPRTSDKDDPQADVKLNPNAKDFKSFLSSMRLRDRDKSKGAAESKAATPLADTGSPFSGDNESPINSRASRDARSTTTLESSTGSRRQSAELVLSPTYSNSEAAASPYVAGKESFMQKISRKSSSSKFSLPTFKRDKARLDRDASATASPSVPPVEDDEDDMSASISSLKDLRESSDKARAGARGWSNVLKLGKKKAGTETPSVSELSMASETTGDEEVDGK